MNDQEINVAIAEACGWKRTRSGSFVDPYNPTYSAGLNQLPSYTSDLNAMHEAESTLGYEQASFYTVSLCDEVIGTSSTLAMRGFLALHATARQRAEAFLRTLGKWKD